MLQTRARTLDAKRQCRRRECATQAAHTACPSLCVAACHSAACRACTAHAHACASQRVECMRARRRSSRLLRRGGVRDVALLLLVQPRHERLRRRLLGGQLRVVRRNRSAHARAQVARRRRLQRLRQQLVHDRLAGGHGLRNLAPQLRRSTERECRARGFRMRSDCAACRTRLVLRLRQRGARALRVAAYCPQEGLHLPRGNLRSGERVFSARALRSACSARAPVRRPCAQPASAGRRPAGSRRERGRGARQLCPSKRQRCTPPR